MTMTDARTLTGGPAPEGISRLFLGGPALQRHLAAYGPLPEVRPDALISALEGSGLTGRGGAGFPAWRKLAATRGAPGHKRPVVIANAAEGEPASSKDAALLAHAPHLVIDGLLLAGAALGAKELYVYVGAGSVASVTAALRERRDARAVRVVTAADNFLSGEASAVVNALTGGPALPQDRTVRLSERGLGGRPTLLHNAETLAQLALIARFGVDWFRGIGTAADPGTRLVTVTGPGVAGAVYEIAGGTPVDSVLRSAGIDPAGVPAVLIGGYHGVWLPGESLGTPLSADGLAPFGGAPGAGILIALAPGQCGLAFTAGVVDYLAAQSARQCGPCMFGLPAISAQFGRLARGVRDRSLPGEIRRLGEVVSGRGACHHPDGTARLVASALTVFESEVAAHLTGRCTAIAAVPGGGIR